MATLGLTQAVRQEDYDRNGALKVNETSMKTLATWQDTAARELTYPAGAELFGQGVRLSDVILLEDGLVKTVRCAASGCDLIVDLFERGTLLGAASAISGEPTPASGVAVLRSRVRLIPLPVFLRLVRTDAEVSWQLHRAHAAQLCNHARRIADLSLPSRQRLESYLLRLIEAEHGVAAGRSFRVALPLKRCELASFLGTTPENLSRLFHALEGEGLICVRKRWLVIPDIGRLTESQAAVGRLPGNAFRACDPVRVSARAQHA